MNVAMGSNYNNKGNRHFHPRSLRCEINVSYFVGLQVIVTFDDPSLQYTFLFDELGCNLGRTKERSGIF